MAIKWTLPFLIAASIIYADEAYVKTGFTLFAGGADPALLRVSMPLCLVEEEKYAAYPDGLSLTMLVGESPKVGVGLFAQLLLLGTGFVISPDISEKFQYPFWLTNFRVQGNVTRHSFVYFKQVTDLFADGLYSESSVGIGLEIKKFEIYGGGAKAVLDPFGLPNEITWRVGVSKWL